jgi:exonuclease SbcC
MMITGVELKNIKSYEHSGTIEFAPGVNAISGPNGAGKSTILEAIGLALFDVKLYTQSHFIREGAKQGEIVVSFIDSLDERQYQVVRPLGSGAAYIYDPEIKRRLASGKNDVLDWIKEHLKVSPSADLQALFEDAIGVPQGLLTVPFLGNQAERKRKFDPLLQVDDYERVWEQLREVVSYLDGQLSVQKEEIAGLRGELRRLPELESEASELQGKIAQAVLELADVGEQLQQVTAQCQALDELQKQIETLSHQVVYYDSQLEGLDRQLADAKTAVQQGEAAQEIVSQAEPGHQAYQAAQARLQELEPQRLERDALKQSLAEVERLLALEAQKVEQLEKRLEEITQAEAQMIVIKPQVDEQARLANELNVAEQAGRELEAASLRVAEEQGKLERLNSELQRVRADLEQLSVLDAERGQLDDQRGQLEDQVVQVKAGVSQLKIQHQHLVERQAFLGQAETAECPVCRQPLGKHQREDLVSHYQQELAQLEVEQHTSQLRLDQLEVDMQSVLQALAGNQEKTRLLPHPGRQVELLKELENQQRTLGEWQQRRESLAEATEQKSQLQEALANLGDPLNKYQLLKAVADERGDVEARLAAGRETLTQVKEDADQVSSRLGSFANLDKLIKAQQKAMTTHQSDHDRYLGNIIVAQDLSRRRLRADEIHIQVENTGRERGQVAVELEHIKTGYDEVKHRELKTRQEDLNRRQAKLEERLSSDQDLLGKLSDQIETLKTMQARLEALESDLAFSQELSEALVFIRQIFRDAKPHIIRQLVQIISAEADRIYSDIMNDYTARLRWMEDYGIVIEQMGNQREYIQLSGGEKMVAALAVRLALLREMSAIRVAFFDEPTANLDEDRRENLAAQITQIKGFDQLFVISHDDSFERDTYHVLHVTKENGISRVEVG